MRKSLSAFLAVASLAALQALPAAAASGTVERQFSQERWMLRQAGEKTSPKSEVRVHFFNPNQVVRVSQRTSAAPARRPTILISRPTPQIMAASRTAARLIASHPVGGAQTQPQSEVRSGR